MNAQQWRLHIKIVGRYFTFIEFQRRRHRTKVGFLYRIRFFDILAFDFGVVGTNQVRHVNALHRTIGKVNRHSTDQIFLDAAWC
ncbi:Uncharacterised protein [Vibrio cholerae]|uniref:Uncharacterized protein n=1 Tax=Vibrio cholerae TaxID=666 RepID=A0A655XFH8_VIBCL|nr:Uncharacterised protein [Vibrio cholerae]CSI69700.1 Uncharacterised protein [Vibrio cholerae]